MKVTSIAPTGSWSPAMKTGMPAIITQPPASYLRLNGLLPPSAQPKK
jgi:hypothetical protein